MTDPQTPEPDPTPDEPQPVPPTVIELDQALIDAGLELARANLAVPYDADRVAAARAAHLAAMQARWPDA